MSTFVMCMRNGAVVVNDRMGQLTHLQLGDWHVTMRVYDEYEYPDRDTEIWARNIETDQEVNLFTHLYGDMPLEVTGMSEPTVLEGDRFDALAVYEEVVAFVRTL